MSGSFKLQLSMEWYLYVAVSGIALLSSIGMLASKYPIMRNEVHSYEISEFVDEVNTAIYSGNLSIRAYIPDGMCNSTVSSGTLETSVGSFQFLENVSFAGNILCTTGKSAILKMDHTSLDDVVISCGNCN